MSLKNFSFIKIIVVRIDLSKVITIYTHTQREAWGQSRLKYSSFWM